MPKNLDKSNHSEKASFFYMTMNCVNCENKKSQRLILHEDQMYYINLMNRSDYKKNNFIILILNLSGFFKKNYNIFFGGGAYYSRGTLYFEICWDVCNYIQ